MDPKELCNYIKEQLIKKGADDAILSVSRTTSNQIKFSNSKINTTKEWEMTDLGIFVSIKKKLI